MTPRELGARARGQKRRVEYMALAAAAGFGGDAKAIDAFFGDAEEQMPMTEDDYEALKKDLLGGSNPATLN